MFLHPTLANAHLEPNMAVILKNHYKTQIETVFILGWADADM